MAVRWRANDAAAPGPQDRSIDEAEEGHTHVLMIRYTTSTEAITPDMLSGFFVGWRDPPSPEVHMRILENSRFVVLAADDESGRVVGFATGL